MAEESTLTLIVACTLFIVAGYKGNLERKPFPCGGYFS